MGGGGSKPNLRITERMQLIAQMRPYFDNMSNANINKTTNYLVATYNMLSSPPEHIFEAVSILQWKIKLIQILPKLVELKAFTYTPITKQLLEKMVDIYIEGARTSRNLETDYNTQFDVVKYYNDVMLSAGNPINKKYISMISGLASSMIYHTLPGAKGPQLIGSFKLYTITYEFLLRKIVSQFEKDGLISGGANETNFSNFLFFLNMCVRVIDDKKLNAYNDDSKIVGISKESYDDAEIKNFGLFDDLDSLKSACKLFLFLYRKKNCSKYIEMNNKLVPDYNTYRKCKVTGFEAVNKPPEEVARLKEKAESSDEKVKELFTQPKIEKFALLKEVETNIKLVGGYVLILIIIGVLLAVFPSVITNVYNFVVPIIIYILTIFAELIAVVGKCFFLAGEGLVFFVISILSSILGMISITTGVTVEFFKDILVGLASALGITTTVAVNTTGEAAVNVGNTMGIFGKTLYNVAEGSTLSGVNTLGLLGITSSNVIGNVGQAVLSTVSLVGTISYNMFTGSILYLIDQITNIFKVSAGSGVSFVDIFINICSLIFKILMNTTYSTLVLVYDVVLVACQGILTGSETILDVLSKNIFNNSQKIYMTINNIDE